MELPYLTAALPGIGGALKTHIDDFIVEEIPLYTPEGVGEHCYFKIEKRGITTMEAARLVARALGKSTFEIGYAGLKDARAVARQWFTAEHVESARIRALDVPRVLITDITRHRNKLKMGHLAGNRFAIKVRHTEWSKAGGEQLLELAAHQAADVWTILNKTGVPNFFGPQRFGMRKDNHLLGLALVKGDHQDFANRFLGDPDPTVDHGDVLTARQLYAKGKLEDALKYWPGHLAQERRALSALMKGKGNPKRVVYTVDLKLKQLLVSALQSHLFNEVLTKRLDRLALILPGDYCWKHENGACFLVEATAEAVAKEQPRADAHEISPSGPLFGWRMTQAQGEPGEMEAAVLGAAGLSAEAFRGPAGSHGGRRALRFFPQDFGLDSGADEHGPFLRFAFTLRSGCYATVLLGEIMKSEAELD